MAAKKTAPRDGTKARGKGVINAAQETTSQATEAKATVAKASPETSRRGQSDRRSRGRPRVSNTDTERVTLRIEAEHLAVVDTLVKLKQYSNRSDAIRAAIKEFCEAALADVDDMIAKQKQRQKLMQLAALSDQLDELSDQ